MIRNGCAAALTIIVSATFLGVAFGAEPVATIIAVEGNVVTISDVAGRKKSLEVVDAKGLKLGNKITWCEDDCRSLRTAERSIEVRRVLGTPR